MSGTQQYGAYGAQSSGVQLDPQGLLGSLLGGAAGGFLGKTFGGSTGQAVGGIAGKILGGFLPLDAGQPGMQQAPHDQPPSQLEMQGFWDVVRKVTGGLRTGLNMGRQLGILEAGQPGAQQPISEIEAQCFSRVINWIARSDPQRARTAQPTMPAAGFSPLNAGQPGSGQGGQQVSQIELQGFWDVLRKVAGGVQTGLNVGHGLGLFEAGQPGAGQGGQSMHGGQQVSQIELQGFWDVLRKVAGGVQTGLNVGHGLGLFEAGQGARAQGTMQGRGIAPEEVQALLQQALPALQAMAQQQQGYTSH